MTSPLVDPQQRDDFLKASEAVGYRREWFGFVGSSTWRNGQAMHSVIVARGDAWRREYPHGFGRRWVDEALNDLRAGHFGPPIEIPPMTTRRNTLDSDTHCPCCGAFLYAAQYLSPSVLIQGRKAVTLEQDANGPFVACPSCKRRIPMTQVPAAVGSPAQFRPALAQDCGPITDPDE